MYIISGIAETCACLFRKIHKLLIVSGMLCLTFVREEKLVGDFETQSLKRLAHAHAMEGLTEIPERARIIRVILSELERIHNYLEVMAGVCTDTAFSVAAAFGQEAREILLRANKEIFGNRLLMGNIVPGGVRRDLDPDKIKKLENAVMKASFAATKLDTYMKKSPSETDRLETTGFLPTSMPKNWELSESSQ